MTKTEVVISNNGTVVSPSLHDACLVGLFAFDEISSIWFVVQTGNKTVCLSLVGVDRFRCDDFRLGNIILDLTVEDISTVNVDDISLLYDLLPGEINKKRKMIIDRAKDKKLVFVRLNPSYGCSFLSACRGIELVDDFYDKIAMMPLNSKE